MMALIETISASKEVSVKLLMSRLFISYINVCNIYLCYIVINHIKQIKREGSSIELQFRHSHGNAAKIQRYIKHDYTLKY